MGWRTFLTMIVCSGLTACNSDNLNSLSIDDIADASQADSLTELAEIVEGDDPDCDLANVNLLDFEAWKREEGWWVGEYTFLGADGDPNVSANWPYRYDHYRGFIHLEVSGNSIKQRNVFLYPAKLDSECDADDHVVGTGVCGVNGNEKIFSADQSASDCKGNLAGPFEAFGMTLSTATTLLGEDTVLYQVRLPDGSINQNQLTTLPPNDTRVRTAQGFFMGASTYASYYRERKVTKEEFVELLNQTREEYNILDVDHCGYNSGNAPSGVTCDEHFGLSLND